MSRRRGHGVRRARAARRRSAWIDLGVETNTTASSAGAIRELVLVLPATDADAVTLVRIVGTVFHELTSQESAPNVALLAWGIHWAPTGSVGSARYNPLSTLDNEAEHWMHLRRRYMRDNGSVASKQVDTWLDHHVDIRVKRKVNEGDGIKLVFNCLSAHRSAVALRGLVLLT